MPCWKGRGMKSVGGGSIRIGMMIGGGGGMLLCGVYGDHEMGMARREGDCEGHTYAKQHAEPHGLRFTSCLCA